MKYDELTASLKRLSNDQDEIDRMKGFLGLVSTAEVIELAESIASEIENGAARELEDPQVDLGDLEEYAEKHGLTQEFVDEVITMARDVVQVTIDSKKLAESITKYCAELAAKSAKQ